MYLAVDLFAGGGGATLGLQQAGFTVIGVDIKKHKNYPGYLVIADVHNLPILLERADFIWASPPCQFASCSSARWKDKIDYPNLIPLARRLLAGHPYTCIENVAQAGLREDLILWGQQFGLHPTENRDGLWRKRVFELSFFAWNPPKPRMDRSGCYASIAGNMGCKSTFQRRKAKGKRGSLTTEEGKEIMGYPPHFKITRKELVESVPPCFSKYIAQEALARMNETGYVTHSDRKSKKHYRETLKWAKTLDEPPFGKPKGKRKKK